MARESSITFRRGCAWTFIWGAVGLAAPVLLALVLTVLKWWQHSTPYAYRQVHTRWLMNDAPGPMLVCGALMACAAAATYFPRGSHRFLATTGIVIAISLAVWLVEGGLIHLVGGGRGHTEASDTEMVLFVFHAPLIVAAVLIRRRTKARQSVKEHESPVNSKALLAKLEPFIALGCCYFVSMLFWPAPARSTAAALRVACSRNLQKLAVAVYEYENCNGRPLQNICGPDGQPLLSWRVAILPFLNEDLLNRFRLDEPWDSTNNAPLLQARPEVFACPAADLGEGCTNYVLGNDQGQRVVMEAGKSQSPWTKPDSASDEVKAHRLRSAAHRTGNGRVRLSQFPLLKDQMPEVEWVKVEDEAKSSSSSP